MMQTNDQRLCFFPASPGARSKERGDTPSKQAHACEPPKRPESGSPFDRGGADSFYRRWRRPHKYVGAQRVDLTDPDEIAEYHRGFNENTLAGSFKDYE